MKNIDIKIQLDPATDGINWIPRKIRQEGKYALIMGTNGKSRLADEDETVAILEKLGGNGVSDYMGHTGFIIVCNKKKIMSTCDSKFIAGSVLIVKSGKRGGELLNSDEIEDARSEFISRLATIRADGIEFSAYEL